MKFQLYIVFVKEVLCKHWVVDGIKGYCMKAPRRWRGNFVSWNVQSWRSVLKKLFIFSKNNADIPITVPYRISHEILTICRYNYKGRQLRLLRYFKTLNVALTLFKPTTSCPVVRFSTNWAHCSVHCFRCLRGSWCWKFYDQAGSCQLLRLEWCLSKE